ncbi:hypothetical protein [Paucisalibacillus sp. EB02]|uniref:hypothetical protein n=1 Tax=Paucisalibacillus sp. EB02 TaxID=1347087 RepID=UPI0004B40161|nr:hypothetical protein [Paucisalibacillus sp. EB02]
MGYRKKVEFHPEGFTDEVIEAIHQLGELRDLELEKCISRLIKKSYSVSFAKEILQYLELINEDSPKIVEKDKQKNSLKINQLYENLRSKNLTPMEKRFIYEEIAELINDMESISRYWFQKSLTSVKYVGAAGAVFAAALLFRKKK